MIKLNKNAIEESAYGITVSFFDSNGAAATPKTLTWSLTDSAGTVINNRKDIAEIEPDSIVTIILKGDDMKMVDPTRSRESRRLLISGTYDDAILGADCPLREEISFIVINQGEAA
jgi:hypothetical protein